MISSLWNMQLTFSTYGFQIQVAQNYFLGPRPQILQFWNQKTFSSKAP